MSNNEDIVRACVAESFIDSLNELSEKLSKLADAIVELDDKVYQALEGFEDDHK